MKLKNVLTNLKAKIFYKTNKYYLKTKKSIFDIQGWIPNYNISNTEL